MKAVKGEDLSEKVTKAVGHSIQVFVRRDQGTNSFNVFGVFAMRIKRGRGQRRGQGTQRDSWRNHTAAQRQCRAQHLRELIKYYLEMRNEWSKWRSGAHRSKEVKRSGTFDWRALIYFAYVDLELHVALKREKPSKKSFEFGFWDRSVATVGRGEEGNDDSEESSSVIEKGRLSRAHK